LAIVALLAAAAPWLIGDNAASAEPTQALGSHNRAACEAQPKRVRAARIRIRPAVAVFQQNTGELPRADSDQAIPENLSAVGIEAKAGAYTTLTDLGLLSAADVFVGPSHCLDPRSPRGPPLFS
jgi:hypothetical protein